MPPSTAQFSVVIPAHNEGSVIDRCLAAFVPDLGPDEAEVVVVGNGCTDDTVERARRHDGVRVVDLPEPSKAAALNAGDGAVSAFPRIYLDADIVVTADTLRHLAKALQGETPLVAAPRIRFVTSASSPGVRAFYRAYEQTPYIRDGLVGLGVYGLNEAGRRQFDDFPDIMADDLFVQRLFPMARRRSTDDHFEVQAPRDLRSLVRVRRRTAAGNRQLAQVGSEAANTELDRDATTSSTLRSLTEAARRGPRQAADVAVYAGVTVAGRLGARRGATWWRDDSTRVTQPSGDAQPSGEAALNTVAYLVSVYPSISHAFIEREIAGLRSRGWHVDTYSVRSAGAQNMISEQMRAEAASTRVIQDGSRVTLLRTAARTAAAHPAAAARTARLAASCGPQTPRGKLWQAFYLLEAFVLYDAMAPRPARHLHVHFANNAAHIARLAIACANSVDGVRGAPRWTWSIAMHGPTEFDAPAEFDLPAKLAAADRVAAISDYCADQVRRLLPTGAATPVSVVPMSVDTTQYRPSPVADPQGRPMRVLYVGRLVPEKRPGDLVEAVARARANGLDCEVAMIGPGPLHDDLVAQARRLEVADIRFLGAVGQEDLPEWYAWADVFCLPSEAEGLPVVLMEAMASGRPVITTDIAAIPELVGDGRDGYVVSPGDVAALADALCRLGADPLARAAMGEQARRSVVGRHEVAATTAVLEQTLRLTASRR